MAFRISFFTRIPSMCELATPSWPASWSGRWATLGSTRLESKVGNFTCITRSRTLTDKRSIQSTTGRNKAQSIPIPIKLLTWMSSGSTSVSWRPPSTMFSATFRRPDLAMGRNRPRHLDRFPVLRRRHPRRRGPCASCVRVGQSNERLMRRRARRMNWCHPVTFRSLSIVLEDGRPEEERALRSRLTDGSSRPRKRGDLSVSLLGHRHPTIHFRRRMRARACQVSKSGLLSGASRRNGTSDASPRRDDVLVMASGSLRSRLCGFSVAPPLRPFCMRCLWLQYWCGVSPISCASSTDIRPFQSRLGPVSRPPPLGPYLLRSFSSGY